MISLGREKGMQYTKHLKIISEMKLQRLEWETKMILAKASSNQTEVS
jgi:hypothetical protein